MKNRIQKLLNERGLTQFDLAKGANVTLQTVTNVCRNHHQPTSQVLYRIAKFLSVTMDELIEKEINATA